MANASTSKPASAASKPAPAAPAPAKTGFDPLRPFRYLGGFIGGTFNHTLNGMANGGRKGMWLGTGLAALMVLSGAGAVAGLSALGVMVMGWAGGLVGGAVVGGTVGAVSGGIRGMAVEHRRDKYSEDLIAKAKARSMPASRTDYRGARYDHVAGDAYSFDRLQQQERENERDSRHFQDMVDHSRHGSFERGF